MMGTLMLKDISTTNRNSIVSFEDMDIVGEAEKRANGEIAVKKSGGLRTQLFKTNSPKVIAGIKCNTGKALTFRVGYVTANGEVSFEGIHEVTGVPKKGNELSLYVEFDAAYFIVYCNAVSFFAQIDCREENIFRVEDGIVWEYNDMEKMDIYADNLEKMMCNVERKFSEEEFYSSHNTENILVSPNGKKFLLNVDDEGRLFTTSIIPRKVLFIGNSLLLGMGQYGMCASSLRKDYFYYVSEAIRNKNPEVQIEKLHGASYEALKNPEAFDELWSEVSNIYTGKSMKESFTEDLDLILIQLGDNVNTRERQHTLSKTIDIFISRIKQKSPRARIIWIHGFFNKKTSGKVIADACSRWRIGQICIQDLNTRENQGEMLQEYELPDGTRERVKDLWISHPGDKGMKEIADRIIAYLKL